MEPNIPHSILAEFQKHTQSLRNASEAKRNAFALRNIVEDNADRETNSIVDTLGRRQPSDAYDGDVNLRTLRLLLSMIDNRGWERYAT